MNIIITGGSSGIGRAVSLKFAANQKNRILVIARSEDKLKELSEAAENNNIHYMAGDIIELSKQPEILLKSVRKSFTGIDILINNAGALVSGNFEDLTAEDDILMMETNFGAPLRLLRILLPLIKPSGHIVNISSMSGFQGSSKYSGLSVYGAAKAALASLTESLATEYSGQGPSFNALSPGAVQTEMLNKAFPGLKAPVTAEEMADFIIWFAVEGSKYFNGVNLPVTLGNP